MKNKSGRRKFIKNLGAGSLTATIIPSSLFAEEKKENDFNSSGDDEKLSPKHDYNGTYSGEYLNRVAFPIGGMGAGMFCMEGTGAISHISVRNKPEIFNEPGFFAAISIRGLKNGAKVLEGPVPDWKKFGQRRAGNGLEGSTSGLPRFHNAVFKARFPFGYIDLTDNELPLYAEITGWSPFIPTDDDHSSLPV